MVFSGRFLQKFLSCFLLLGLFLFPVKGWTGEVEDEIPEGAGADWAYGFRAGAELHVGNISDRQVLVPSVPPETDSLFEGPSVNLFVEKTLSDYFRFGFEFGGQDAVVGAADTEQDFTQLFWGPYLRASLRPGRFSPYGLAGIHAYHAFAKGALADLDQEAGFAYVTGGGIEIPITRDYTFALEGRFHQFLRDGTDPKTIELFWVTHLWWN